MNINYRTIFASVLLVSSFGLFGMNDGQWTVALSKKTKKKEKQLIQERQGRIKQREEFKKTVQYNDNDPLFSAIKSGDFEAFRIHYDQTGLFMKKYAFQVAVKTGKWKIVEYCLCNGMDANQPLAKGNMTALHWAAIAGHINVAKVLIQHGADINAQDTVKGRTPLLWVLRMHEDSIIHASKKSHRYNQKQNTRLTTQQVKNFIQTLIDLGGDQLDVTIRDHKGNDAYYYINNKIKLLAQEHHDLIELLDSTLQ